jgi:hypothetical protein
MARLPLNIQRVIDEGYEFKFGDYISKGFNLIGRDAGGFIGYFLVIMLLYLASFFIPIVGPLAFAVISPVLIIGFAHVAHRHATGRPTTFNDFFRGFDKFGELFLTALLTTLLAIAFVMPGYIMIFLGAVTATGAGALSGSDFVDPADMLGAFATIFSNGMVIAGILLSLIPAAYISVVFSWSTYFVWFYDMRAWDAMQASRRMIHKQFWWMLLFLIAVGFIGVLGFFILFIGVAFTYPAMLCAQYAAFADVTGVEEESGDSADIIDHFAPAE